MDKSFSDKCFCAYWSSVHSCGATRVGCGDITNDQLCFSEETVYRGGNLPIYFHTI